MTAVASPLRAVDHRADRWADLACPVCMGPLNSDLSCHPCDRLYPRVAGLPDLRTRSDRYLGLADERRKASRLARLAEQTDFEGLVRRYYEMTPDVDARRRRRYVAHLLGAEVRGRSLALQLDRGGRTLEVGCGTAGLIAAARREGIAITGADIALRWLVLGRRRLQDEGLDAALIGAEAERLPWSEGVYDAVVADSLLEHLPDPSAALREWARVVRPGGRLLVWGPNRYSIAADPHVGLWGVGWLPRRWAGSYVRWRRGCAWTVSPLGPSEVGTLARAQGWTHVKVTAPEIPAAWGRSRFERAMIAAAGGIVRSLGGIAPLWQLEARRGDGP